LRCDITSRFGAAFLFATIKAGDLDCPSGAILQAKSLAAELRAKHALIPPDLRISVISEGVQLCTRKVYSPKPIRNAAAAAIGDRMNSLAVSDDGSRQPRALLCFLPTTESIRKAAIAGLCGSATHSLLMLAKAKLGILESFQPYQSLQMALIYWTGDYVHPAVPWLISYLNGSTLASFAFANLYGRLPGNSGPMKGFISGVLGWLVMDLIFFPLLGLGPFAKHIGLGLWPALFALLMMLTYSIVMGIVYGMIEAEG
jgi:hypothetical protein